MVREAAMTYTLVNVKELDHATATLIGGASRLPAHTRIRDGLSVQQTKKTISRQTG